VSELMIIVIQFADVGGNLLVNCLHVKRAIVIVIWDGLKLPKIVMIIMNVLKTGVTLLLMMFANMKK